MRVAGVDSELWDPAPVLQDLPATMPFGLRIGDMVLFAVLFVGFYEVLTLVTRWSYFVTYLAPLGLTLAVYALILIEAPSSADRHGMLRVGKTVVTNQEETSMRFYNTQHPFYCGIDLHARMMYVCILDQSGEVLVHRNMKTDPEAFLRAIAPYRPDIVVAVECMFTWYWLADLCAEEDIPFVLGHALYMKAIHGGKAKNDKIDSQKIAVLLRGGMLPQAYVYPSEMRATRDLLRRRMHLARKRGELLAHVQNTNSQYNLSAIGKNLAYQANRDGVAERFADPAVQKSMEVDLALVSHDDTLLRDVELTILKTAKQHDANTLYLLQTVPGIGKILSLVLLYEIHHIERFPRVQDFASYCRLVKCAKESGGKRSGTSGSKIGNAHLKWAFSEAAVLFLRDNPEGQKFLARLEKKHGKGKALTILAHKLARAVYYMLKRKVAFDMKRFLSD
jgi:transposase